MDDPLVSVLMPARNAERWIGEALASATVQEGIRVEVVVVDDGSSDGTAAAAERFASRGVRVLRQESRGQCAALNRALAEARGDYVQYLDADDVLGPGKIAIQVRRLRDRPGCVASGEWARFHGRPGEARFAPEPVWRDLAAVDWLAEAFSGGLPMMQAGIWLLPRAVAERAGPWDEGLTLVNDFDYFTRVLLASEGVLFCPGARLFYRSGVEGSLSSRRTPAAWESALRSLLLGTGALLAREDSPRTRSASADVLQVLAHSSYPDHPGVAEEAERRARELGGSRVRLDGGLLLRAAALTFGWRAALRIRRAAAAAGYDRVARAKESLLRGRGETA